MIADAGGARAVGAGLHLAHHGHVADLRPGRHRAGGPDHQRALLGVGGAAVVAVAAIDARRALAPGRRDGGERGGAPFDPHLVRRATKDFPRRVHLVRAVRIGAPRRPPGILHRAGDAQGALGLVVVGGDLLVGDRPVEAVAELALGLEPLRPEAQRHHGEVHGGAAHPLSAVVARQRDRIAPAGDPRVGPVEHLLRHLVGREILQRPPVGARVEADDGEALLRQPRRQRRAAGARAHDGEVDLLAVGVAAHGRPAFGHEDVRRPAVLGAWRRGRVRTGGGVHLTSRRPITRRVLAAGAASLASQGSCSFKPMRT